MSQSSNENNHTLHPPESTLPPIRRRSANTEPAVSDETIRADNWRDGATVVYRSKNPAGSVPVPGQPESDVVDEFFRDLHMPEEAMEPAPHPMPAPQPAPVPRAEPKGPAVNAYNRDYGTAPKRGHRVVQSEEPQRKETVENVHLYPEEKSKPAKREAPVEKPKAAPPKPPKKKKWPWVMLFLLLIFVVIPACLWFFYPDRPDRTEDKNGNVATFLLAGTDEDGTRTDTMMLLYVNRDTDSINLLSLPRDSRVVVDGNTMKLNAVYGYGGCGEDGMEMLMHEMVDVIGYEPDAYMLFNFESLAKMIDTMGGITFDVPMDMYYEDSSQDLYIDLKAGTQTLNGDEAVQVLRYRSGYALADLERINVQRKMVNAAMHQWLSPKNAVKGISAINDLSNDSVTNVTTRNFFWLAQSALYINLDDMKSETLPGEWESPYYELYHRDRAAMINDYFNPTNHTFTGEDFPE